MSPKTERNGKGEWTVPIFGDLRPYLVEAQEMVSTRSDEMIKLWPPSPGSRNLSRPKSRTPKMH
jgi:hypothetical protein